MPKALSPVSEAGTAAPGLLRRVFDNPVFILPRDFTLFLRSARTDAAIRQVHGTSGARAAFEAAYT